jgi:spermidine synthase
MSKRLQIVLLISVFVVATCGLIYELVAGTLASYLLGDSVTQFSTIIGAYLFSMGIGSYFSKFFKKNLLWWFIQIEIIVGLVGGFSSTILFLLFEQVAHFRVVLYLFVSITGILVGLEIPLLMRILKDRLEFGDLVSKVFTFDYIGALLASIIFPLLLIPYFGIMKTSLFFGMLNVLVALLVCIWLRKELKGLKWLIPQGIFSMLLLVVGFILSDKLLMFAESLAYQDTIIYTKSSPYQRIVVTKTGADIRLFLNGNLQFSSKDEYRYHEALVHPVMSFVNNPKQVLVLGGGDGLAVREVLKYPSVETITLVDLDPSVTSLFLSNKLLTSLNEESLSSSKLTVVNQDAFTWVKDHNKLYDAVIIDFPDPSNYSLGKLYTTSFYKELAKIISPNGFIVIQSTSPYFARQSYWIIDETLHQSHFSTLPYHCYIPSFGEWGFIIASKKDIPSKLGALPDQLKFINEQSFSQMKYFPADMARTSVGYNSLNSQLLVQMFEKEWSNYTP